MKMKWLHVVVILLVLFTVQLSLGSLQGGALAPEGVYGESYHAPFPVTITLDGEFDDWQGVPQVYMGQGVGRPAVSFAAAADEDNLYLYADVIDTNIISGEHGDAYWNEDSVEFYLNGTGNLELRSYQDGVAQLTFPALNRQLPFEDAIIAGVRGASLEAQVATVETTNGWAIEVAIPLKNSVWEIQPEQDGVIGFQVHLNAASELNRDTKLIWGAKDTGDQSYQNPSLFGQLIFHEMTAPVVTIGEYHFASMLGMDGTIDDFENGIWLGYDREGNPLGLSPQDATLAIHQVLPDADLALPAQTTPHNILGIHSQGAGQFLHAFTDGFQPTPQDWSQYNALGLWLHSGGNPVQVDILAGEQTGAYTLTETRADWQYIVIPIDLFATDSPLDLSQVHAYGIQLPLGDTDQAVFLDHVKLYTLENTAEPLITNAPPASNFIADPTITWESRDWELVWSDEFEGAAETPINAENWTCEIGGEGWGNNELQYYTTKTSNVSLDGDGNLAIVARQESPESGTCWYGACAFTSARCITRDKVEFTYGRVEARLRIPRGQGIWPAFWMLGADFPVVGWPESGEIDIMENIGREPRTVHGTIHGPGYSGASGIGGSYAIGEDFADDFHVYAIEWTPNIIRWYVDGNLFSTLSRADLRHLRWVFDHDFFLIMNIAVGGSWPGFPNDTTEFPQTMLVDYVRLYQLK